MSTNFGLSGIVSAFPTHVGIECEHRLERHRRSILRIQLAENALQRDFMVGVRIKDRFTHGPQQITECDLVRDGTAQHHCVDENTDEPFCIRGRSFGYWRADGEILCPGETIEQDGIGRQHHHVKRDALLARQRPDRGRVLIAKLDQVDGAVKRICSGL